MTRYLPKPSSDRSFGQAIAAWRAETRAEAPELEAESRDLGELESKRSWRSYATYGVAFALALGAGATAASLATAPQLTDSLDTVAAIDARAQGFAQNLDPAGQQKKAASLSRDVGAMKTEITRLQRALDQSRANQAAASKSATGQAAANAEEVKSLKGEIANLQKTLDATKGDAATKIEGLNARLEQSKQDATQLAQLKDRLERFEKFAQTDKTPAPKRVDVETTGSVDRDARRDDQQAAQPEPVRDDRREQTLDEQRQASRDEAPKVVRNWVVRDVQHGVALLEGREGLIEVTRGARAPGMGRVRSIERRDGQWVVVTDRGVVMEREQL